MLSVFFAFLGRLWRGGAPGTPVAQGVRATRFAIAVLVGWPFLLFIAAFLLGVWNNIAQAALPAIMASWVNSLTTFILGVLALVPFAAFVISITFFFNPWIVGIAALFERGRKLISMVAIALLVETCIGVYTTFVPLGTFLRLVPVTVVLMVVFVMSIFEHTNKGVKIVRAVSGILFLGMTLTFFACYLFPEFTGGGIQALLHDIDHGLTTGATGGDQEVHIYPQGNCVDLPLAAKGQKGYGSDLHPDGVIIIHVNVIDEERGEMVEQLYRKDSSGTKWRLYEGKWKLTQQPFPWPADGVQCIEGEGSPVTTTVKWVKPSSM